MKTRVFADDGQPESWDYNDNYQDLDQVKAWEQVLHQEHSSANRQSSPAASPAPKPTNPLGSTRGGSRLKVKLGV